MPPDTPLRVGTCSWKYESWRGLVYTEHDRPPFLDAYARHFNCVEVDQWFWSLYGPGRVVLPDAATVRQYAAAVPDTFRFGVKLPNSLTLTHYRQKAKTDPLVPNPHFLSLELLMRFLDGLEPLHAKLGPLMLQFGYLNKQKMASQGDFLDQLAAFAARLPAGFLWAVESRNPNYLNARYFTDLRRLGLAHVFLQGYYMPPIFGVLREHAERLADTLIIRLHGPDREGIEERTGSDWSKVVEPKDAELDALADVLSRWSSPDRAAWLFANNHFEGSAPQTVRRLQQRLAARL